jgi:dTDP-glucose 4,6-dehydratase
MLSTSSVLVTGGAGFLGSNFVHNAVDRFDSVYVLDKLTYAGRKENLSGVESRVSFVEGDIRDRECLDELYPEVDYVVNFAAHSHVDRSIDDGLEFVRNNVEGAFVAMDALRDHDIETFVQISTDEVYGSTTEGTFSEEDRLDPSSPYSASKASADLFVNALQETYDLPIAVVRPTNAYGPRQNPEKLIPKFILRALNDDPLPLYGDGRNVRQWLYVDDLCDILCGVLERGDHTVYNAGGTERRTNLEVTRAILDALGKPEELIEFVEDRAGHDRRYAVDDDKLESTVGVSATTPFEEGIERTVEWYCERASQLRDR